MVGAWGRPTARPPALRFRSPQEAQEVPAGGQRQMSTSLPTCIPERQLAGTDAPVGQTVHTCCVRCSCPTAAPASAGLPSGCLPRGLPPCH